MMTYKSYWSFLVFIKVFNALKKLFRYFSALNTLIIHQFKELDILELYQFH